MEAPTGRGDVPRQAVCGETAAENQRTPQRHQRETQRQGDHQLAPTHLLHQPLGDRRTRRASRLQSRDVHTRLGQIPRDPGSVWVPGVRGHHQAELSPPV